MRRIALLVLLAFPLFAQHDRDGRGTPSAPNAVDRKAIERANDELAAQRAAEQSRMRLRSRKLKDAIHDFKAGDFKAAPLHVTVGEFVAATGQPFTAVHIETSAELPEQATFFGEIVNDDGSWFWSWEENVTLSRAPDGTSYYERSFAFPPGNRTATFGLAVKDDARAIAVVPLFLAKLDRNARRVSPLIVSKQVFPLATAQKADDPFAFGGLKVVPKADRTFHKSDALWLFFEAQNPALAENESAPKLTTNVTLEGADGKKVRALTAGAEVVALKGVPGHFGVGTTLDLSRFAPGAYNVRVSVSDKIAGETYELLEHITVVE
ncbi:MAG TPA: hypothetical protein VJZ00_21100 [Thermoanaerobaculia bacterium]|nr:hypothetical protein [Thermoanaerobaculia bacterium]